MPGDARPDRTADDEADQCRNVGVDRVSGLSRIGIGRAVVNDDRPATNPLTGAHSGAEVRGPPHPVRCRQHGGGMTAGYAAGSGRQLGAALAASRSDDGAPGACAHTQPEAVRLRTTAVVRLEGALAHGRAPTKSGVRLHLRPTGTPRRVRCADSVASGERRPLEVTHLRYGSAPPRVKPTPPHVPPHGDRTQLRAPAPTRGQPHTRPASRGKPAKISRPESIPAATRRTLLSSTDTAVSFPDQPLRRSTPT